jgi:hypothetical protein
LAPLLMLAAALAAAAVQPPADLVKAAEAGDAAAQQQLGALYGKTVMSEDGEFVKTYLWLARARVQNSSKADEKTRAAALEADRELKLVKRYIPREARDEALKQAFPSGEAPDGLLDDRLQALEAESKEDRYQAARDITALAEFRLLGTRRNAVVDKLLPLMKSKDHKMQTLALEAYQEIGRLKPVAPKPAGAQPEENKQ